MTKSDVLTEADMTHYVLNEAIVQYIEAYCRQHQLQKHQVRILDWGCGRGEGVAWLRAQGYNAFGVEINQDYIHNGSHLFAARGLHPQDLLHLIRQDGSTLFPDNHFDVVYSKQVFEHVSNLMLVAQEIHRVTKSGGISIHSYPAHRSFLEPHLSIPIVHWMPKNLLRKVFMLLFLFIGVDPQWRELQGASLLKRADVYWRYINSSTYYRSWLLVKRIFTEQGFDVVFTSIDHPVSKRRLQPLYALRWLKPLLNLFLIHFVSVELLAVKRA